jgi:hypothetical protein
MAVRMIWTASNGLIIGFSRGLERDTHITKRLSMVEICTCSTAPRAAIRLCHLGSHR